MNSSKTLIMYSDFLPILFAAIKHDQCELFQGLQRQGVN